MGLTWPILMVGVPARRIAGLHRLATAKTALARTTARRAGLNDSSGGRGAAQDSVFFTTPPTDPVGPRRKPLYGIFVPLFGLAELFVKRAGDQCHARQI